jgi:hypothetical protein
MAHFLTPSPAVTSRHAYRIACTKIDDFRQDFLFNDCTVQAVQEPVTHFWILAFVHPVYFLASFGKRETVAQTPLKLWRDP